MSEVKEQFSVDGDFSDATVKLKVDDGCYSVEIDGEHYPLKTDLFKYKKFAVKSILKGGSVAALCYVLCKSGIQAYDFKPGSIAFNAKFDSQYELENLKRSVQTKAMVEMLQMEVRKLVAEYNETLGYLNDFRITSMQVGARSEDGARSDGTTNNTVTRMSGGIVMQARDHAQLAGGSIVNKSNHYGTVNQGGQNSGSGSFNNSGPQNYNNAQQAGRNIVNKSNRYEVVKKHIKLGMSAFKEQFSVDGDFSDATLKLQVDDGCYSVKIDGEHHPLKTDLFKSKKFAVKSILKGGSVAALCYVLYKSGIKAYDFKPGSIAFNAEFDSQDDLENLKRSVQTKARIEMLQMEVRKLVAEYNETLGHLNDFRITSMQVGARREDGAKRDGTTNNTVAGMSGGIVMQARDNAQQAVGSIFNESNRSGTVNQGGQNFGGGSFTNSGPQNYNN